MSAPETARKQVVIYLILTFVLSSVFYYLILSAGTLRAGGGRYVLGLMWSPGLAALLTRLFTQGSLRGMGWGWGRTRYQLASYFLPLAYAAPVYLVVWFAGLAEFNPGPANQLASNPVMQEALVVLGGGNPPSQGAAVALFVVVAATAGMIGSCLSALGEEIGWRGLLVPELAKLMSFPKTALLSGAIWSVWHYPALLFADYRGPGTPTWYSLLCFTVLVLGMSFPFAWLRLKSGSLWTGMFLHASHNLFIQGVLDPMTRDTGPTKWLTGEFGAGLALTALLAGILFWRKRARLETARTEV